MPLLEEIPDQECDEALSKMKSKSAPGTSGISYPLIRKVGSVAHKIFVILANKCIREGEILMKWKIGQLYPIPKNEE